MPAAHGNARDNEGPRNTQQTSDLAVIPTSPTGGWSDKATRCAGIEVILSISPHKGRERSTRFHSCAAGGLPLPNFRHHVFDVSASVHNRTATCSTRTAGHRRAPQGHAVEGRAAWVICHGSNPGFLQLLPPSLHLHPTHNSQAYPSNPPVLPHTDSSAVIRFDPQLIITYPLPGPTQTGSHPR
jgi:hypothetical protein